MTASLRNCDILFDWDLDPANASCRHADANANRPFEQIGSSNKILEVLIRKLRCRIFIVSNMSNNSEEGISKLKEEVEKLGLRDYFANDSDVIRRQETCSGGQWVWRWGNCIACGDGLSKVDAYAQFCLLGESVPKPWYYCLSCGKMEDEAKPRLDTEHCLACGKVEDEAKPRLDTETGETETKTETETPRCFFFSQIVLPRTE